ncbi:Cilia- and flagella-associated protein 57 [Araneus ventricosus]|uniref:Cilia-and flagella-associated protein 57 n=1 Tax=Araneus ventricosus TaxID=182803 RepID=A0A4Y2FY45_ARAVE|nr:Cilia- and flagella-associated protein 57 [Araneus ventricosus]
MEVPPKLSDVYGFQQSVRGGFGFSGHNTLFYLAGKQGVHHELKRDGQHFTAIPEKNEVTAAGFGSNNLLLIAVKGQKPLVSIFNLKTNGKKTLTCANKVVSNSYVWVRFSEDGLRVGALGGLPDWAFVLWNLDKKRLETVFHPFRIELRAEIYKFSFCPSDSKRVVAVGRSFLRAYRFKDDQKIQETALHELERSRQSFHCAAWVQNSCFVVVGTSNGKILVFQNMHLVQQVDIVEELERIHKGENVEDRNVTCIITTADGFLCSHGSSSVLYFKEDFKLRKVLIIPKSSKESRVVQMSLNPQEDTVGIATKDGRILTYSFSDRPHDQDCEDAFRLIQDFQHTDKVIHADTLPAVSLQASCSKSRIILRDFSTERVFLREELPAAPCSLSLCPLATTLAIGQEGIVRVCNIVLDALVETKCFEVTTHSQVSFAPGSHILAFTDNNVIRLCYSIGFKELTSFERHTGKVHILRWRNDNHLLSSDDEGAIYEWDIPRKRASWKLSVPEVVHTCIATPCKGYDVYVASADGKIRRIKDGIVLNNCSPNVTEVTAMSVIEEWLLIGTRHGKILGLNLCLSETNFQVQCQTGSIIHFAILEDAKSMMAIDEFGVASTWYFQGEKGKESLPSRAEVLIDLDKQKESIQCAEYLEEELRLCTEKTEANREKQRKQLQEVEAEAKGKYSKVEDSLKATVQKLKEELEDIKKSKEENHLNMKRLIENEKEENEKDFLQKLSEEEARLEWEKKERASFERKFQNTISQMTREKREALEDFQTKYARHQERLQRLKDALQKSEFSHQLEGAAVELSTEGNQKIEECEEEMRQKSKKLQEIKDQLQKCKESQKELGALLKVKRREETVLNERLKSTENSVMDNTRKLLAADLLLERYRMEFVNSTSECPNATALRWAMLRLYEKRVAKPAVKEESLFFTDTDPYIRFCKQRDHYENLINVVRSRTSQIKATFRENSIKLAKVRSQPLYICKQHEGLILLRTTVTRACQLLGPLSRNCHKYVPSLAAFS